MYVGSMTQMLKIKPSGITTKFIKISCTPSSVTWHMRNGLVFWAVDPTGSLRSDQPLFKNREEQVMFRNMAVNDPGIAIPPNEKICAQLIRESIESHKFGKKKLETVKQAIANVGKYWLRDALSMNNVERFFE